MLTVEEVAPLLHLAPFTVRRMARLKQIPGARKIGRAWLFRHHDLQRFIEGQA